MRTSLTTIKSTCIIAAIAGSALIAQAVPIPINGTISFSGSSAIDGDSFLTATQFLSFQEVFVGSPLSVNGDYLGTSGAEVTMATFMWNPTTASTPISTLWSFEYGGNTYSYDLHELQVDYVATGGLFLSGLGTARITGPSIERLETPGQWNFSAQAQNLSTFTFSSSTTVPPNRVPVPITRVPDGGSTAAMLGGALICLGTITRKTFCKRS